MLLSLAASLLIATTAAAQTSEVVIALASEVAVDDDIVRLEQIAKLSGGTADARRRLAKLDVAELKLFAQQTTVSASQVKFRLVLAGFDAKHIRLTGAKQTIVTESDEPLTRRKVLASAESALRQKYPGELAKVSLLPAREFVVPLVDVRLNDRVQLDGKVVAWAPRASKARVDVAVIVNGKTRSVVPVAFEVAPRETIATVGAKEVGVVPTANVVPAEDPLEILIKNRDLVKIVARIGTARIEAGGEAMEDGRLGAAIRVRNTESNRVVSGRVEARGIVVVDN
jgi:hypothetical protein